MIKEAEPGFESSPGLYTFTDNEVIRRFQSLNWIVKDPDFSPVIVKSRTPQSIAIIFSGKTRRDFLSYSS